MLNINTLPEVNSVEDQIHRKKWGDKSKPVYMSFDRILPMQIFTDITATNLETIEAYDVNDVKIMDVDITETGYTVFTSGDYKNHVLFGGELSETFPNVLMYLKFTFDDESEINTDIFQPVNDTTEMVELEWWNDDTQEIKDYEIQGQYSGKYLPFRCFFDSNIGLPTYPTEDVIESVDGYEYMLNTISKKEYKFGFWASEGQLDAIRFCRLADYVNITYNNQIYKVHSIDFEDPEWNDKGCYAWVDVTFIITELAAKNFQSKPTRGSYSDSYSDSFII